MEDLQVTCSLGVIGPLLAKLHSLTAQQRLPEGVSEDDLPGLIKDLEEARDSVVKLSKVKDPSFTDKCLMKEVREICYDAEDYIHMVLHSSAAGVANKVMMQQRRVAEDVSELRARLQGAKRRRERCQHPVLTDDMQQDAEQGRENCYHLAGVDGIVKSMLQSPIAVLDEPMKELIDLLALDGERQLKVVSIFGIAGIGKTTLARTLYSQCGGRFHCRAFLRVSRNPDTRRLLTSMLSQIKGPRPKGICDIQALTKHIRTLLQGKRYLIIVDDLWATSVWDFIRFTFPEGDHYSRIISTTQIEVVALACCSYRSGNIYEMRRPSRDDQAHSFFGALDRKEEVLNLIYNSLAPHLKTCLLYLNMFPEDFVIRMDDLVKQWVAEGFLGALGWPDAEKHAKSFFDELLNKGMIQAVETNYNNEVLSCTVHHMVRDFIACKSREENFITVMNYSETMGLPDKVRRLCLRYGGAESAQIPGNFRLYQVRSLLFSGFFRCVPSIVKYRLLRVLILHIWADDENTSFDLRRVCELFLLKYLNIACNIPVTLPDKMAGLQFLETLEVDAKLDDVPLDIVHLRSLLHLRLPGGTDLPHGIGGMESLLTLGYFDLSSNSEDNVRNLGELRKLQDLYLTCSREQSDHLFGKVEVLGSVVQSLSNLKSLTLVPGTVHGSTIEVGPSTMSIFCDGLNIVSSPRTLLERLIFSPQLCIFSSLPKWIAELSKLCILKITARVLQQNDINILKGLNVLKALSLYVVTAPEERIVFDKEGFQFLKHFRFICSELCLSFVDGAMSNVRRLKLGFNANGIERYSQLNNAGFENLTSLEMFVVKIGGAGADNESVRKAAQSALMDSFGKSRTCPIINVQPVSMIFYDKKEKGEAAEREQQGCNQGKPDLHHRTREKGLTAEGKNSRAEIRYTLQATEFAMGALGPLLPKLGQLLQDEYNLRKGAKKDIEFLINKLERIHTDLRNVGEVSPEQLSELGRIWAHDIREQSYDMEDIVDTFLLRVQGLEPPSKRSTQRFIKKMVNSVNKAMNWHEIAQDIKEVLIRRDRYKVDAIEPAKTLVNPRLTALYTNKAADLAGIDEARKELITRLTIGGDMSRQKQRIVSIVGFEGLGKTTLAKAVYDQLKVQFDCTAFISVSLNPDLKKLLTNILYELDKEKYGNIHSTTLEVKDLIGLVREFLGTKRYLIVIDDICDIKPWGIIRRALLENGLKNIIITTTRMVNVAEHIGGCYKLKPLTPECSKILFYGRIFGSEDKCPRQLCGVCEKILRKCGGVPLAIITTASLLANKQENVKEWYGLCDSIDLGLGSNPGTDNMREILSLSYYDLPPHLKTCLLYISIFPEDYKIGKERLIWRWIAEDFVQHGDRSQSLFELGESYFNELVNRSLLQVADTYLDGSPLSCRVHDMVLELICSLSREESFVTTVPGDSEQRTPPRSGSKVRRLSLHSTTWPTMEMSKLRSLTIFSPAITNSTPSLSYCHLLRVLDLNDCNLKDYPSLGFVGNLFHLRYLGLGHTKYAGELPVEIGKLQFLQTLDIVMTGIEELPSSMVELRRLMCLSINARLPDGLRNLVSLEDLGEVMVDSVCIAEELGHLTRLRRLAVKLKKDREGRWDEGLCTALVGSLAKLHKIQFLEVISHDVAVDLEGLVGSLGNLRMLAICGTRSLPTWVSPASLPLLSCLVITVVRVRKEDIHVLGMLPALRHLEVKVSGDSIQVMEWFSVGPHAFPCAVTCRFNGFPVVPSTFQLGAMPRVENFEFSVRMVDFSSGGQFSVDDLALRHLPSLKSVRVWLHGKQRVSKEVVLKVEETLRHEMDVHPNHPWIDTRSRI